MAKHAAMRFGNPTSAPVARAVHPPHGRSRLDASLPGASRYVAGGVARRDGYTGFPGSVLGAARSLRTPGIAADAERTGGALVALAADCRGRLHVRHGIARLGAAPCSG